MNIVLILASLSISFYSMSATEIIYGEDNRVDIKDVMDPVINRFGSSIAGRVANYSFRENDKDLLDFMAIPTLSSPWSVKLCADEKFGDQPSASDCTAFLIADDLMATAGHCVTEFKREIRNKVSSHCSENSWMFDYKVDHAGKTPLKGVSPEKIYGCKEVVYAVFNNKYDYAIFRLDRKVEGRAPLKLNKGRELNVGDDIFVIGHPSGLPLKYADKARVFHKTKEYYSTNLDTFGGNSGSPVFNKKTLEVEGILVRGDVDYYLSEFRGEECSRVNVCHNNRKSCNDDDPGIDGEHVTKISKILRYIK